MNPRQFAIPLLFAAILAGAWLALAPGLTGPFLLDDFLHLPKLSALDGQIDTPLEVYQLAFSSERIIGRQLSYLSLLVNDNAWPTAPYGFKRTNLLVHLLNGVLVFVFARQLARLACRATTAEGSADWIALAAMALWIAHPIHLSPTMMVIQRMTLFAGTFSLLAMIAYLHGRRLAVERPGTGLAWMTFGFGACLALGVFSKEPAVMTGLYILALEATVLGVGGPPRPTRWGLWAALFVGLPLLAVAANFVLIQTQIQELFLKREFDLGERLLTESRVLMQYLRVILAPSLSQSGPYHDDFSISRGLLDPATTALSIAAILGMVVFAAVRRRANPLLALGILWFFAGHLLESTVLPIELYFEHRNYLPMLGFAFAAACGISQLTGGLAKTAIAGLLAYLALTAGVTYASARVWGDERLIAVIWAPEHPASVRAQNNALRLWARRGDTKRLIEQFELVERSNPNDAGMYLLRFILDRCRDPGAAPLGADFSALQEVIPRARFEHGSVEALQWILKEGKKEGCEISNEELDQILGLYLANPRFYGNTPTRHNLLRIRASVYTRNGDLDSTIKILDDAFAAHPSFEVPLNQAWLLATAGLYDDAAQYLNKSKETPPITVGERLWRDARIAEIEALIGRMRVDGVGTSQRPPAEPKDDRR